MGASAHKVLLFGGFTLDPRRGCVLLDDREVALRPKSYELLRVLVENAGRLVPKDELFERVWPDVVVNEDSLARCMSDVRRALGDGEQRLIRTIPRRGYLFCADVSESEAGPPASAPAPVQSVAAVHDTSSIAAATVPLHATTPGTKMPSGAQQPAADAAPGEGSAPARSATAQPAPRAGRRHRTAMAGALLLAVALGVGAWFLPLDAGPPLPDKPSIAVLPFGNPGGDAREDYFSDGISEDLITKLSKSSDLFVIAPDSASRYRGAQNDERQIGRRLGVRYLLRGSVRRQGEHLHVTARLVDTFSGSNRWAEAYDLSLEGLFAMQDEVTQKITSSLVSQINASEFDRVSRKPDGSMVAYDYYLRGRSAMADIDARTRAAQLEHLADAQRFLLQALEADPRSAAAMTTLARTYVFAWIHKLDLDLPWQASLDRALPLAWRAVELEPYRPEANSELAWILHWQYRRDEAMAYFERALQLNPNLPEGRIGLALAHNGRAAEAIDFMKRVMRRDPLHRASYFSYLGNAYFLNGQFSEALPMHRIAAVRAPELVNVHVWHAAAAAQMDQASEARAAADKVLALQPVFTVGRFLDIVRLAEKRDSERLAHALRKAGLPE